MVQNVTWQVKNVGLPQADYPLLEVWLAEVARRHGRILGNVNYLFCDDAHILDVNRQFLQHDYYTDIITFDYCRGKILRGDMVISLDTIASNAQQVGAEYINEFYRVVVHGLLHLCGINDKGPGEREIMEQHENDALQLLTQLQNN